MADLLILPAGVDVTVKGAIVRSVEIGDTIDAGKAVYLDDSDQYQLADNTSVETAEVRGIMLTGGVADDVKLLVTYGPIDLGITLSLDTLYVVSDTAGGIAPYSDLGSGDYISIIGYPISTSQLFVDPNARRVVV